MPQYLSHITSMDALFPDDPLLGIPPDADKNVMKITDDCLFIRSASGSIYGGDMSMSWWGTLISIAMAIFTIWTDEIMGSGYTGTSWTLTLLFPAAFSWTLIPWRCQLPIIFNRRTRKAACYFKGKAYVQDWDSLMAFAKSFSSFHYGGFLSEEGILTIFFTTEPDPETGEKKYIRVPIYGTSTTKYSPGNRIHIHQAVMIWEFIRLFMREGKEALPPIVFAMNPPVPFRRYCPANLHDAFDHNLPTTPLRFKPQWWPLSISFFLICLPFCALGMATDIVYLCLDRLLPRRKWPKELLEACDYAWDGSNDHGHERGNWRANFR